MLDFRRTLSLIAALAVLFGSGNAQADDGGPFELQPMVGYSFINLTGLSEDQFNQALPQSPEDLVDVDPNSVSVDGALDAASIPVEGQGPSVGLAAQLHFLVFVIGARYTFTGAEDFQLHTVQAEAGLRLGGKVALYGRLGAGYTLQGGLPEGINTDGFVGSVAAGLDVKPSKHFSFGLGLDFDVLALSQSGQISSAAQVVTGGATANEDTLAELDGSALGYQLRPQLHLTWHL